MQTKTVVKVISLYDLISDNLLILLATLHHIIIIAFNYYYIHTLEYLIEECEDEYRFAFEELQTNLEFCQGVTLFTFIFLFVVIAANTDSIQLNQNRVLIMFVSFMLKTIYSLQQYWHYGNHYVALKQSKYFEEKYIIVLLTSYDVRLIILVSTISVLMGACIVELTTHLVRFLKNYRITLTENIKVNEYVNKNN